MNNPFDTIEKRLDKIEAGIMELAKAPKPEPTTREKYLTIEQVAELLSVSRVTLWHWDKKGILESVRVGNLRRYRLSDIELIMNQR